jgi:hypothetical protein
LVYYDDAGLKIECRDSKKKKGSRDAIPLAELVEVRPGASKEVLQRSKGKTIPQLN